MSKKNLILDVVDDCVKDLVYYNRKECEDLPVGEIEAEIKRGNITVDEIVDKFKSCLVEYLDCAGGKKG